MDDGNQPFGPHPVIAVETIQSPSLFLQLDPEDLDMYFPGTFLVLSPRSAPYADTHQIPTITRSAATIISSH